jgi:hypothetical protein
VTVPSFLIAALWTAVLHFFGSLILGSLCWVFPELIFTEDPAADDRTELFIQVYEFPASIYQAPSGGPAMESAPRKFATLMPIAAIFWGICCGVVWMVATLLGVLEWIRAEWKGERITRYH